MVVDRILDVRLVAETIDSIGFAVKRRSLSDKVAGEGWHQLQVSEVVHHKANACCTHTEDDESKFLEPSVAPDLL
jgi:hypothetical protein